MKKINLNLRKIVFLSVISFLIFISSAICGCGFFWRFPLDFLIAALAFQEFRNTWPKIVMMSVLPSVLFLFYIVIAVLSMTDSGAAWTSCDFFCGNLNPFLCFAALLQISSGYLYDIVHYFSSVRNVMKYGTIWNNVCLRTDLGYSFVLVICLSVLAATSGGKTMGADILYGAVSVLLLVVTGISVFRKLTGRVFILFPKSGEKITESIQSSVPDNNNENNRIIYEEIYKRLNDLFKKEKSFLDETLTIYDVSRALYTNKVYVSRAVSIYSGKNFCQFTNTYRIRHALELFRKHPEYKVSDLSIQCGFHNVVSFSSAFRLNMGCTPSEWCRAERGRLRKMEK